MGYRSHGYIIFPEALLAYWEEVCPATPLDDFDFVGRSDGYITLNYSDWKWYDSYEGVKEMENFMSQIDDWADQNNDLISEGETYTREELESGEYPWVLDLTLHQGPNGTINNFGMATYESKEWDWAFSQQGEEHEDYTQRGISDMGLYQDRRVDNPWGLEYGHAWQVSLPMTLDQKDIIAINELLDYFDIGSYDRDWDEVKPYNAKYPPYRALTVAVADSDTRVIPCVGNNDKLIGFERTDGLTPSKNPESDDFRRLPKEIADKINAVDTSSEIGEITGHAQWDNTEITYEQGELYEMDIYVSATADNSGYMEVSPLRDKWAGGYAYTVSPELLGIDDYKDFWRSS